MITFLEYMATLPPEVRVPRIAWIVLGFLWIAYLINYVDRQMVYSIFPALRRDLGFTDAQLGLAGSIFVWIYSLCMPFTGRLADLAPRDRLIVASLVLWSFATLGTGLSHSVGAFLFWRGVMGVTESLYVPAALALIASLHPAATRSRALSIHATAQLAGIVTGGWFGGWAADNIGWRQGIYSLTAAGIVYAVVLFLVLRRVPKRGGATGRAAGIAFGIFRLRCYLALSAAFFWFSVMLYLFYAWLPTFIYERFALSLTSSGLTATLYLQVSTAVGVLTGGVLADKLVPRRAAGRFYVAGAGLLLSAPFAYLTLAAPSVAQLKLASAAFGLLSGLMIANVFASAYDVLPERSYGFGAGVLNMIGGLSGGAGILLAGLLKGTLGITGLMGWAALASSAAAAVLLLTARFHFESDRQIRDRQQRDSAAYAG
ncbi:MAG: MFS transporter [Bryobacteraceae bacterium]|nr:MFS transporter [Bryobacteraceae bacterium]